MKVLPACRRLLFPLLQIGDVCTQANESAVHLSFFSSASSYYASLSIYGTWNVTQHIVSTSYTAISNVHGRNEKERKSVKSFHQASHRLLSFYETIVIIRKAQIQIQFRPKKYIALHVKEYVSVEVYPRSVLLISRGYHIVTPTPIITLNWGPKGQKKIVETRLPLISGVGIINNATM